MLHLLAQYARSHGLVVPPGFAPKQVRWAIRLGAQGEFLEVVEMGEIGAKRNPGRRFAMCPEMPSGFLKAGKGGSHFLVESLSVVALHAKNKNGEWLAKTPHFAAIASSTDSSRGELDPDLTKLAAKHGFFVQALHEASSAMPELKLAANAVSQVGTLKTIAERLETFGAKPTDKATFQVAGRFLVDDESWHQWWIAYRARLLGVPEAAGRRMVCLVSGAACEPVPTHDAISSLADVGGSPMGSLLVSFDKEAFTSYSLEQAANAAVSEAEAQAYRLGLNNLLNESATRLVGAKVVHWFKERVPTEDDPLPWIHDIGDEAEEAVAQARARKLLEAIRSGERPDLQANRYFALTLSGAAGRVMVRDWMDGQFEALVANVADWFNDLAIVRRDGHARAPDPKFLALIGALGRELKDVPSPMVTHLWRAAVTRSVIASDVLCRAVARFRATMFGNEPFNHARMGLMRAYHVRKGDSMMQTSLNEQHPSAAYHCGRLMALLARIQYAALGDVGAGVVQRYYAAASTTPALVLGRLSRTAQFHLGKLDAGLARWFEARLAGIWDGLKQGPPVVLTLEEQSLFALGYYQQIAADRAERGDHADNRSTEVSND